MTGWLILIGLTRLALVWLDRRRSRDLDREWEQVDRRWRHHESWAAPSSRAWWSGQDGGAIQIAA